MSPVVADSDSAQTDWTEIWSPFLFLTSILNSTRCLDTSRLISSTLKLSEFQNQLNQFLDCCLSTSRTMGAPPHGSQNSTASAVPLFLGRALHSGWTRLKATGLACEQSGRKELGNARDKIVVPCTSGLDSALYRRYSLLLPSDSSQ